MQWTVFASIFDGLVPPTNAAVAQMIGILTTWVGPYIKQGLLIFVPLRLIWGALKHDVEPVSETMVIGVAGGVALYVAATTAGYIPIFRDNLLNGIQNEIGGRLAGTLGNRPMNGALFDALWIRAWLAGLVVYKALPWSIGGIGLMIAVVAYWLVALIAIAIGFVIWISAYMALNLLVGVGPLFCGLFVFPWFRAWAWGWLNTTMASVVLQILTTALLTLILGVAQRLLAQLVALNNMNDQISQLQMLFGGVVLFLTAAWVALQLPGIASSITSGFAGYGQVHIPRGNGKEAGGEQPQQPPPESQGGRGHLPNGGADDVAPQVRNTPPGRAAAA